MAEEAMRRYVVGLGRLSASGDDACLALRTL